MIYNRVVSEMCLLDFTSTGNFIFNNIFQDAVIMRNFNFFSPLYDAIDRREKKTRANGYAEMFYSQIQIDEECKTNSIDEPWTIY